MSELYRLIFRGEVLDGQHPAVVRRKLGQLLSLDEARLDRLFSGQPVVVKAEADAASAARFQELFRKAGARLVVGPAPSAVTAAVADSAVPAVTAAPAAASAAPVAPGGTTGFEPEVLPVGSDVLREDERQAWEPREIDTAHLELQEPGAALPEPPPAPPPPDTSKFRLVDPE
jgi:hypothetical protein